MKYELKLEITDTQCLVPTSHKLNSDGYFRKVVRGKWVMFHREIWSLHNGEIPEDHEIDHLCKNRACCNIQHLQCLHKTTHRAKDNMERSGSEWM